MYCSTCGARVPEGRSHCDTCGAVVLRQPLPAEAAWARPLAMATCPRCGYRGEGVSHFSRGGNVAIAVGLTLLSAGVMGIGGLIYYLLRRDHTVCPRCGRGWGKEGELALLPPRHSGSGAPMPALPSGGGGKQAAAVLLFLLAAVLVLAGVAAAEIVPGILGGIAASAGIAMSRSASIERQKRRDALLAALQLPVLRLARQRGGHLTVTDVATDLGWTMKRAEKVLHSLDDGLRVTSDVTDEGLIVYAFPELLRSTGRLGDGED